MASKSELFGITQSVDRKSNSIKILVWYFYWHQTLTIREKKNLLPSLRKRERERKGGRKEGKKEGRKGKEEREGEMEGGREGRKASKSFLGLPKPYYKYRKNERPRE